MTLVSLAERPKVIVADMVTTKVALPCATCVHTDVCAIKESLKPVPLDILIPRSVDERIRFYIKADMECERHLPLSSLEPVTVVRLSRMDKVRLNLGIVGLVALLGVVIGEGLIRLGAFHL